MKETQSFGPQNFGQQGFVLEEKWNNILQMLNERKCGPRISYPAKMAIKKAIYKL